MNLFISLKEMELICVLCNKSEFYGLGVMETKQVAFPAQEQNNIGAPHPNLSLSYPDLRWFNNSLTFKLFTKNLKWKLP